MNYSKIDLEKSFPYATMKEALVGLQKRSRSKINVELGFDNLDRELASWLRLEALKKK